MTFWHNEKDNNNVRIGRVVGVIILFFVVLWLLFSTFITVPPGHRGVVIQLGAVQNFVLDEGFHTIVPFTQSIQMMEVRTLKYEVGASAATEDLLDVRATVAVNYHLDPGAVNDIFQSIGLDYESRLIAPAVQEAVKANTAKFKAEELVQKRETVKAQIEESLKERLLGRGILVETISLTEFEFPEEFNHAIVAKQTAIQLKLKAQNDLETIKVEAQQAVAKAEGQSEAIGIINQQLQKSPQYIQFLATQKWDGKLPIATGGVMPFIQLPTTTP